MESLFHIKCHKILDHHQVEVAVVIVDSLVKEDRFVVSIKQKELKILMFATNGDQDTLKDETNYYHFVISYNIWRY
jgi:hypothetical protein